VSSSEDFSDAGLAFTCTEDDTLWKLDLDYNSAIERYYPVVAVSDDRGRSWSDRTATVAAFFRPTPDQQTADPTELRTSPVGIAFSGTSDGWILLTERRLATATHHLLLRTSDAGASWERLPDPPFPAPSDPDLYFGDGFTTISLGSRGYGALSGASCVLADGESCVAPALVITSDGGRSFTASDPQPVLDSPLRRVQRVVFAW